MRGRGGGLGEAGEGATSVQAAVWCWMAAWVGVLVFVVVVVFFFWGGSVCLEEEEE